MNPALLAACRFILKTFFAYEHEGVEHLPDKPVILAGNHQGFLDAPMILSALDQRPVQFLMAEEVFSWPLVGPLVRRHADIIPVHKGGGLKALEKAAEDLRSGTSLGIFPEGRLTPDGRLGRFHKGVARLQEETGAPIVPFAIHGGFEAWPMERLFPKIQRLYLQFGQPIFGWAGDEESLLHELRHRVQFMKDALERRHRARAEKVYTDTVISLMQMKYDLYGARTALAGRKNGAWREVSYIELARRARNFGDYLLEKGVKPGDRIALLSESSPDWGIAFFAIIRSGGIVVPLDTKLTVRELQGVLEDAEPAALLASAQCFEKAETLKSAVPSLQYLINLDEMENLKPANPPKRPERDLDETALLVYTSGTTGNPKGAMITFGNLIFQVRKFEENLKLRADDAFLSILPLNHLIELTGGFLGVLHSGGKICYGQSLLPNELLEIMREKKITSMITVPLALTLFKGAVEREVERLPKSKQDGFRILYELSGKIPWLPLRRLFFKSLHEKLGGKFRRFISGGAPLSVEVGEFFWRLGMPVYQGYGLTECSPAISSNTPKQNRLGSVGRPLSGVHVRIEEGEILTKGPHVMKGYYKNEALTREMIDEDGWLHTGDLGALDHEGYLYITGRRKNLIVLGGGKKVQPEEVEEILQKSPLVKEVCILGRMASGGITEGTEEVCAVVVPSKELKERTHGDTSAIKAEIEQEFQTLYADLATFKRPSRLFIHLEDLPKTVSLKIKRPLVEAWVESQEIKA